MASSTAVTAQFTSVIQEPRSITIDKEVFNDYMDVCVSYRCKECSSLFDDKAVFYQHCLDHLFADEPVEEKEIFVCSTCGKAFNTRSETKKHIKEHSAPKRLRNNAKEKKKLLTISIDTKKTDPVQKRTKYKMRAPEKFECPKRGCSVSFKDVTDVDTHNKCHLEEDAKTYSCFVCTKLFHNWPSCAIHLYNSHEINCGLITCTVCQVYKTWAPLKMENHMRIHSDLRAFTCKVCSKTFKQASQLRNHIRSHEGEKGSKTKQCTSCFKVYSNAKALKKHKDEVHNKLRPFLCNVCGHASARRWLLVLHQRQHTNHKPLVCSMCSYATADHNSLRAHTMRHTGVRPYNCPACTFSGIRSGNYIRHVKQMHPGEELIFTCDRCPYKTVSEDNYTRHISDHLTGLIKGAEPGSPKRRVGVPKGFKNWLAPSPDPDDPPSVPEAEPIQSANEQNMRIEISSPPEFKDQNTVIRRSVIISAADF